MLLLQIEKNITVCVLKLWMSCNYPTDFSYIELDLSLLMQLKSPKAFYFKDDWDQHRDKEGFLQMTI